MIHFQISEVTHRPIIWWNGVFSFAIDCDAIKSVISRGKTSSEIAYVYNSVLSTIQVPNSAKEISEGMAALYKQMDK